MERKKNNFSIDYKTFEDWLNNFKGSESYKNRIITLHSKFPNASLSQLRGHPKAREKTACQHGLVMANRTRTRRVPNFCLGLL